MSNVVSILSAPSASTAIPSTAAAPTSDLGKGFKAALADASKRPADEKTEKVAGHHYEKIVAGPDKGHFINRTGKPSRWRGLPDRPARRANLPRVRHRQGPQGLRASARLQEGDGHGVGHGRNARRLTRPGAS